MKTGIANSEPCVLVVDDHEISRQHTAQALSSVSNRVWQVSTGSEARECAALVLPDLIFMDIHLPDSCGLTLPALIKEAWPPGKPYPIFVILSGDDSFRMLEKAEQTTVHAVLVKPVQHDEIRNIALRLLGMEQGVREDSTGQIPRQQLRELFLQELKTRLPQLDRDISSLNWGSAAELMHQLIASSALCREQNLEFQCRRLHRALLGTSSCRSIAEAYFSFLQTVDHVRTTRHAW